MRDDVMTGVDHDSDRDSNSNDSFHEEADEVDNHDAPQVAGSPPLTSRIQSRVIRMSQPLSSRNHNDGQRRVLRCLAGTCVVLVVGVVVLAGVLGARGKGHTHESNPISSAKAKEGIEQSLQPPPPPAKFDMTQEVTNEALYDPLYNFLYSSSSSSGSSSVKELQGASLLEAAGILVLSQQEYDAALYEDSHHDYIAKEQPQLLQRGGDVPTDEQFMHQLFANDDVHYAPTNTTHEQEQDLDEEDAYQPFGIVPPVAHANQQHQKMIPDDEKDANDENTNDQNDNNNEPAPEYIPAHSSTLDYDYGINPHHIRQRQRHLQQQQNISPAPHRHLNGTPRRYFLPNTSPDKCNADIHQATCHSFQTYIQKPTSFEGTTLIIPCGTCVELDIHNGTNVTLPGILNVIGKFKVPPMAHVTVFVKGVVVQGVFEVQPLPPLSQSEWHEMHLDTYKNNGGGPWVIPNPTFSVKFHLYGTDDVTFVPDGQDNAHQCGTNGNTGEPMPCNEGPKAWVVAGGQMNVTTMSEDCPSFAKLVRVESMGVNGTIGGEGVSAAGFSYQENTNQNGGGYANVQSTNHDGTRNRERTYNDETTTNFQGIRARPPSSTTTTSTTTSSQESIPPNCPPTGIIIGANDADLHPQQYLYQNLLKGVTIQGGTENVSLPEETTSIQTTLRYFTPQEYTCILPEETYILSGRFSLRVGQDGGSGRSNIVDTQCVQMGVGCPSIKLLRWYSTANQDGTRVSMEAPEAASSLSSSTNHSNPATKSSSRKLASIPPNYHQPSLDVNAVTEEWHDFSFPIAFSTHEVAPLPNNHNTNMHLHLALALQTTDIYAHLSLANLRLQLPPPSAQPGHAHGCENLLPADGKFENLHHGNHGISTYPFRMYASSWKMSTGFMNVVYDQYPHASDQYENHVLALRGRRRVWEGLEFNITGTQCILMQEGMNHGGMQEYVLQMRYRVYNDNTGGDYGGGKGPEISFLYPSKRHGGGLVLQKMGDCPEAIWDNDGAWTVCALRIVFSQDMKQAPWLTVKTIFWNDATSDIDFDDISFLPITQGLAGSSSATKGRSMNDEQPWPNALVLSDPNAAQCWGPGAELLITSDTLQAHHYQQVTVAEVDKEKGVFLLTKPLAQIPTTTTDHWLYGVEVALLNRNFVIDADQDETKDGSNSHLGGHLIVLRTPHVVQTLQGIELRNMGRQGELGRYPIHFHIDENCEGSKVSRNVIRQSHQRCVVIHGTHNVTVEHNVAFDTFGHCFLLEDGGEHNNTFQYNLGAMTKAMPEDKRLSHVDTDHNCATFWFTNPRNHFIGNIAAGSERMGIWMEFFVRIRGPSQSQPINRGIKPKFMSLGTFRDNTAHSSRIGISFYKPGYRPPSLETFENSMSYRNSMMGMFIHGTSDVRIVGGHFADNSHCVRVMFAKHVEVEGLTCVGVSESLDHIVRERGSVMYENCCSPGRSGRSNCGDAIAGVSWSPTQDPGTGVTIKNVTFLQFNKSHRCTSEAISGGSQFLSRGLQTSVISTSNLSFVPDTSADGRIGTCLTTRNVMGGDPLSVQSMGVEDYDGTIRGSGKSGFYFTDTKTRVALVSSNCKVVPNSCMTYCEDACARLLIVQASPSSFHKDTNMVVTDENGNKATYFRKFDFKVEPNGELMKSVSFYSAWLPKGQFSVSFVDPEGSAAWPDYVYPFFEAPPMCSDFPDESSLGWKKPPYSSERCDELVKNGDFEMGDIHGWQDDGTGITVKRGGSPKSPGYALYTTKRSQKQHYMSVFQMLDVSCTPQLSNAAYIMSGSFRFLDQKGSYVSCDASLRGDKWNACPSISFKAWKWDPVLRDAKLIGRQLVTKLVSDGGETWSTFSEKVQFPSDWADADAVAFEIDNSKLEFVLDDFSLRKS